MNADQRFRRIIDEGQCIGCGLCAAMFSRKLRFGLETTGYLRPQVKVPLSDEEVDLIYATCPGVVVTGLPTTLIADKTTIDPVWGPWQSIVRVHAADPVVRFEGATGGSLTALSQYLLDSGTATAILHVKSGGERPSLGSPQISRCVDEVRRGKGSCYAPAAPLKELVSLLDKGEPFAVVAKPCDISAVRLYADQDSRVDELVTHCLTMVCGGVMPPFGFDAFLARSGIDPGDVVAVRYRGHGCPGPTRITLKNGDVIDKTYVDFWGEDESMWHLPWRCKICPDGTGEAADIASADTWPGGTPTAAMMATDAGTNACIARTVRGAVLLCDAIDAGYLNAEGDATTDQLSDWQPHQVKKKYVCEARYDGLRAAGHLGIETRNLGTHPLAETLSKQLEQRQIEGVQQRIEMGKHRDDFGISTDGLANA